MQSFADHFLVAMPSLHDNEFAGTLVYIAEHDERNGAIGVVINRPVGRSLKNVFNNIDVESYNPSWVDYPLYWGGPISTDRGYVLHRCINSDAHMLEISNDKDVLAKVAKSQFSTNLLMTVGYSSWDEMQLEAEVKSNDWLIMKANLDLVFEVDPVNRHAEALKMLGISSIAKLYSGGDIIA